MNNTPPNFGDLIVLGRPGQALVAGVDTANWAVTELNTDQIEIMAQSVAWSLSKKGYGPGDRVGIKSQNCLDSIIAFLAILKLGATAVLISERYTPLQMQHLIQDSKIKMLFTDQPHDIDVPTIVYKDQFSDLLCENRFVSYQPHNDDTATIVYTAGSTGTPKGVQMTHQARLAKIQQMVPADIHATSLISTPMSHNVGMVPILKSLYYKSPCVILNKFHAESYVRAIEHFHVSCVTGVPSMFQMLYEQDVVPNMPSVKEIVLAGESTSAQAQQKIQHMFPNAKVHLRYGSTEAGPGVFVGHPSLPTPPGSVGCAAPGIDYRLINGVLEIRSPYMMKAYVDDTDNFTSDGYYVTNDVFTVDSQGFYYYQGRADDMFKSGGNKIFPIEIEQAIESHPGVAQCAVVPVPDNIKGTKPFAFVVTKANSETTPQQILAHARTRLALYQCPNHVHIIDQIPLTQNFKVDKLMLKKIAHQLTEIDNI